MSVVCVLISIFVSMSFSLNFGACCEGSDVFETLSAGWGARVIGAGVYVVFVRLMAFMMVICP